MKRIKNHNDLLRFSQELAMSLPELPGNFQLLIEMDPNEYEDFQQQLVEYGIGRQITDKTDFNMFTNYGVGAFVSRVPPFSKSDKFVEKAEAVNKESKGLRAELKSLFLGNH